jgi:hypothetical protein
VTIAATSLALKHEVAAYVRARREGAFFSPNAGAERTLKRLNATGSRLSSVFACETPISLHFDGRNGRTG